MKKVKSIIGTIFVIGIIAVLMGAGTQAYFSDTETSTGNKFDAGTVDLELSDLNDGIVWSNGLTATWHATNWLPGDTHTDGLHVRNMGTVGVPVIRYNPDDLTEDVAGYADEIILTDMQYTELGVWYGGAGMLAWYEGIFGDGDGVFTLREFVDGGPAGNYCLVFWIGGHPPAVDYLPPGGASPEQFKITFKLDENAGNAYQGATATFDLNCIADGDDAISGKGSGCYGYS